VGPLLEQFRQSILAAAFSGRLTADWREKNPNVEPAHELLARIRTERRQRWEQTELAKYEAKGKQPPKDWKDKYEEPEPIDETDLPELPDGWCWTTFESLTENFDHLRIPLNLSDRDQRSGEYPYYGASGIIDDIDDFLFDGSFLLIGEDGANLIARSTPIAFIADGRFWVNNHAHIVQALGHIPLTYLEGYVNSIPLESYVTGSAQPKLTQKNLNRIPIALAPIAEQSEIVSRLSASFEQEQRIADAVHVAVGGVVQLNQSILAKAFRGELVPQDPNDEPASELLARIRREREVSGDSVQGSGRKKKARRKGTATVSAPPAKRSKRSSTAASATTPDASTDPSPEPARPQRRRRRSSSISEDPSLVIRVLAEGGAVNIHADTSGPTVQFYTKSSGGGFLAEIEDIPESALQPRESKRVATLRDIMEPDLALLYPKDVNETYLPQLRDWYTWAAPQLPEHFESEFLEQAKFRWLEALEISAVSGTAAAALRRSDGRLFDS
jgi:type I restriction enzyme S subunit